MKQQIVTLEGKEPVWGYIFLFLQIFALPILVVVFCLLSGITQEAMQNVLCFAANFICVVAMFPLFWWRSIKQLSGKGLSLLRTVATYMGVNYICTVLVNILIYKLDPEFMNANDNAIAAMTSELRLLMYIAVVLLVPPVEEFVYRGVVFGQLYKKHPLLGYLVSVLVFSGIHVLGYIGTVPTHQLLLSLLQYIPISFCLARAYAETGNLFAPILIHTINNFIAVLSM